MLTIEMINMPLYEMHSDEEQRYYEEHAILHEVIKRSEELMKRLLKEAHINASMYVHPDLVEDFLYLLADMYYDDDEFNTKELKNICKKIGLTKRHILAIQDDMSKFQDDVEDEIMSDLEEEQRSKKELYDDRHY